MGEHLCEQAVKSTKQFYIIKHYTTSVLFKMSLFFGIDLYSLRQLYILYECIINTVQMFTSLILTVFLKGNSPSYQI